MIKSAVKIIEQGSRMMIVIDNCSEEDKKDIINIFGPQKLLTQLNDLIVHEEAETEIAGISEKQELINLISDGNAMKAIGHKEVLWRLGKFLYPDSTRESMEQWFDKSSKEEHQTQFQKFKQMLFAS